MGNHLEKKGIACTRFLQTLYLCFQLLFLSSRICYPPQGRQICQNLHSSIIQSHKKEKINVFAKHNVCCLNLQGIETLVLLPKRQKIESHQKDFFNGFCKITHALHGFILRIFRCLKMIFLSKFSCRQKLIKDNLLLGFTVFFFFFASLNFSYRSSQQPNKQILVIKKQ